MNESQKSESTNQTRRELLVGMGAAAIAFAPMAGAMSNEHKHGHKHDHSKHKPQHENLLSFVNDCLDKGQRCISHCLTMFQEGDVSVADCAAKVHEMLAVCRATSYLLTANSSHIKSIIHTCRALCHECAVECEKHKEHHECRACMEACESTVAAIDEMLT